MEPKDLKPRIDPKLKKRLISIRLYPCTIEAIESHGTGRAMTQHFIESAVLEKLERLNQEKAKESEPK